MTTRDDQLAALAIGVDQAARLLDDVGHDDLATATPCADWTVSELVDHLVAAPVVFTHMVKGEDVDWSAPTPHAGDDRAAAFRANAEKLLEAWRQLGDDAQDVTDPDWQCAEIAVHTYDLAAALGRPTADLATDVAERGLAFMHANLKPEMREPVFGSEQPAPEDADAYQRIAAFAGRTVTPSR
jgi:uncharacterized protein (TIGR03086 family)